MSEAEPSNTSNKKGIYFLPSLFTTAGLFFGCYAIIRATKGEFDNAAIAILVAIIMDGLDGRIARWTNTTSNFGKEYDSLADMVSFGLAPALVIYFWSLQYIGRIGWLFVFIYVAATALRLARFNSLTLKSNRYFYGLACPMAAVFTVFWVWFFYDAGVDGESVAIIGVIAMVIVSILQVSNIKFRSFKDFDIKNKIPFIVLILILLALVVVWFDPPKILFLMSLMYVLSGPAGWLFRRLKGERDRPAFLPDEDENP